MQTADAAEQNIRRIAGLFPGCVTETKDPDGTLRHAIDFDKLRAELGEEQILPEGSERYEFTWPGKRQAAAFAYRPIRAALRPCPEESVDFDNTHNLYIEGDNLDVLKLLRETYLGKVKMIYIDPPYNTGNDFVYKDDFKQSTDDYLAASGQFDDQGQRLETNTETNGRYHTDWLNMIYPRLRLARELLTDDGVIFISIDDHEVENLKKVCNEVFGEGNFVGNIIWQSRTSISNDDEISTNHNHTLVYSKLRGALTFSGDDIDASEYINPDNDPRGPWKLVPIDANHVGGDTYYPIKNPKTGVDYYPPNGRIWCYNRDGIQKLMDDGRIKFGLTDDSSPKRKLFYNERIEKGDSKTPSSILLDAGSTQTGTEEIMDLFDGEKVFDYPKPSSLVERFIKYGFIRNRDIVLDFFSGSATTAAAVFKYNNLHATSAQFILVQIPEDLDVSAKKASNNAKKSILAAIKVLDSLGKPHTICEIGKERIRRAGKKIREEMEAKQAAKRAKEGLFAQQDAPALDTGFRVLKLASTNMEDVYYQPRDVQQRDLFKQLMNVKGDRTPLDLLFQVMLDLGITLDADIREEEIAGKQVYRVNDTQLVACFEPDCPEAVVEAISRLKPLYAVVREPKDDATMTNFDEFFKTNSPDTHRRTL